MSDRFDDWVRHYENQFWSLVAAFLAANIALLFLSLNYVQYSDMSSEVVVPMAEVLGLAITCLTAYFAAGIRQLRHRAMQSLGDESAQLFRSPRLPQWWAFIALLLLIAVAWTFRLLEYASDGLWMLWYVLGLVSIAGIAVVGFLYRRPRRSAHD